MENQDRQSLLLSDEEGQILVKLARRTIALSLSINLQEEEQQSSEKKPGQKTFQEKRATFVTLHKQGELRGCMGTLSAYESLADSIRHNAVNAAFNDPRFPPLTFDEFRQVNIEISILTDAKPLDYENGDDLIAKLRPGVDGVILQYGSAGATFLPQVWEQLPRTADFLGRLCMKAGLNPDTWKSGKLAVQTYQVQHFSE
ncbi:MAG: AmmeMemoRadiSam system protein A [Pseudomonadota bacterium]